MRKPLTEAKVVLTLRMMESSPALTARITREVDAFFARNPQVQRSTFAEWFIAGLEIARLGKPSL